MKKLLLVLLLLGFTSPVFAGVGLESMVIPVHVILLLVSALCIAMYNIVVWQWGVQSNVAAVLAAVFAVIATFVLTATATIPSTIAAIFTFVAVAAALNLIAGNMCSKENAKAYKVTSGVFYISIVIALFV